MEEEFDETDEDPRDPNSGSLGQGTATPRTSQGVQGTPPGRRRPAQDLDAGSARKVVKRRKYVLTESESAGEGLAEGQRVPPHTIHGVERLGRRIGYSPSRHLFLAKDVVEYCAAVEMTGKLPDFVEDVRAYNRALVESKLRTTAPVYMNKARESGADMIFFALPTGYTTGPSEEVVPAWNEWDSTLPICAFRHAVGVLAQDGLIVFLYSGELDHISDVLEGMRERMKFEGCGTWQVALDKPVYCPVSQMEVKRLFSSPFIDSARRYLST